MVWIIRLDTYRINQSTAPAVAILFIFRHLRWSVIGFWPQSWLSYYKRKWANGTYTYSATSTVQLAFIHHLVYSTVHMPHDNVFFPSCISAKKTKHADSESCKAFNHAIRGMQCLTHIQRLLFYTPWNHVFVCLQGPICCKAIVHHKHIS